MFALALQPGSLEHLSHMGKNTYFDQKGKHFKAHKDTNVSEFHLKHSYFDFFANSFRNHPTARDHQSKSRGIMWKYNSNPGLWLWTLEFLYCRPRTIEPCMALLVCWF